MMTGWIRVHRALSEHQIWLREPFTMAQAWVDLLMRANYHNSKILRGNRWVEIERGQLLTSILVLSSRWKRDRKTVRAWLAAFASDGMLDIETAHGADGGYTLLTIQNYEKFQRQATDGLDNGLPNALRDGRDDDLLHASDHTVDDYVPTSKEQVKKGKKEAASPTGSVPGPSLDQYLATLDTEAQVVVRQTVAAIAATRKGGKVAQKVLDDIARRFARFPLAAVLSGCRIYCTRDCAGQGKREHYLLGIIRNQVAERNGDVPSQPATKTRGQQLIDRAAAVVAEGNGP